MQQPQFYIVGAPKCGTTAMHHYLAADPNLTVLKKELHYWGSDLSYMYPRLSEKAYNEHLDGAPPQLPIGEVAVWYLPSFKAAAELKAFTPNAKIICMLRNPVDAAYSLHAQMVYTGNESEHDFEKALALEGARRKGEELPKHYYCPEIGLRYTDAYRYAEQLQRYQELFPTEQLHFVRFEDLKEQPEQVYTSLLRFLGVASDFLPEFEQINASQVTRNEGLRDLTLTPSKGIKSVVKTLLPSKKLREKIKATLWKMNSKEQSRAPLPDQMRKQLSATFNEDVLAVEKVTGWDLSGWKS